MIDSSTTSASIPTTSLRSTPSPGVIDIAMVVSGRKRLTHESIQAVRSRTYRPYRLMVLNNGSDRDTTEYLSALAAQKLIDVYLHSDENKGIHWAHNKLLEHVESFVYVSTDNDIVPQSFVDGEDWLQLLGQLMLENPEYAAISLLPHALIGDTIGEWVKSPHEIIERAHAGAVLRLMQTDLVREVGGWSDKIMPARNNEERWICKLLRDKGKKVGYARDIRAIHLWGKPDLGEDEWGYPAGSSHGHRDVWPPPSHFNWDRRGISWETCR